MATPARHICRTLFKVSRQIPVKRKCQPQSQWFSQRPGLSNTRIHYRELSTSLSRRANENGSTSRRDRSAQNDHDDEEFDFNMTKVPEGGYKTPSVPITLADLDAAELADYHMLSPKDREAYMKLQNHYAAEFEDAGIDVNSDPNGELPDPIMDKLVDDVTRKVEREVEPLDFPDVPLGRKEAGFWADEEDDEFSQVPDGDEVDDESDITSVAHNELDLHREIREYTRVIAWDMPLLQKFAKPFQPPTKTTPLRFRYTTYLGEYHVASRKVVLQFCTKDLPDLTEPQRVKLCKLVGSRYNPDTDMVKMSCELFEAPAQNKRYLGDQVKKLLDEARDKEADSFEDIPLDLRHHKTQRKVEFPEAWKLSSRRVRELAIARQEQKVLAIGEGETGASPALDGQELVHSYVSAHTARPSPLHRPM